MTATDAEGNWVHLRYRERAGAERALARSGRVFPGRIMVGVVPCERAPTGAALGPALQPRPRTPAPRPDYDVDAPEAAPRPSSSALARAFEFVFGW